MAYTNPYMQGKGIEDAADLPTKAIERLTEWESIAKLVAAFGDPWAAAIVIAIIVVGVVAIVSAVLWATYSYFNLQSSTKLELAKLGIVPKNMKRISRRSQND